MFSMSEVRVREILERAEAVNRLNVQHVEAKLHRTEVGLTRSDANAARLKSEVERLKSAHKETLKSQKEAYETQIKDQKEARKVSYNDVKAGNYSDFKVKCFEKTFHLHRIIVCPKSEWFVAALKPGTFIEGTTGLVSLPDDDPRIFSKLVQLIYFGELEDDESGPTTVVDLAKLYVMSDKYRCPEVKEIVYELAVTAFDDKLGVFDQFDPETEHADQEWDSYTEAVIYLFANIPSNNDRLKQELTREAAMNWKWLILKMTEEQITTFLREVPDFAIALASSKSLFGGA